MYLKGLIEILIDSNIVNSRAEAKRLIMQGGVTINGIVHDGKNMFDPIEIEPNTQITCRNKVLTFDEIQ